MTIQRTEELKQKISDKTQASSATASETVESWSSVKDAAEKRCASLPSEQFQAVCIQQEKESYEKMQGDFGMPVDVAKKAKKHCESLLVDFISQSKCMEMERESYDKEASKYESLSPPGTIGENYEITRKKIIAR